MAVVHKGSGGIVKVGTNTVANVTQWSLTQTTGVIESTVLSDTSKNFIADPKTTWTAQVDARWDYSDTTGQEAMTIGATVAMHLLPDGSAVTNIDYNGSAIITSIVRNGSDGKTVDVQFSCQGTGALTKTVL